MNAPLPEIINQHLIDPEICIRCNTCEDTCPVDAITHDSRNYVVDASICNLCMACVPPCPTGSIDNWRKVIRVEAYSVQEQLGWDVLPEQKDVAAGDLTVASGTEAAGAAPEALASGQIAAYAASGSTAVGTPVAPVHTVAGATVPPWSAAHPYVNLYGCWISVLCRFRCLRVSRWAFCPRVPMPRVVPIMRANTPSPVRAMVSVRDTTTSRSP